MKWCLNPTTLLPPVPDRLSSPDEGLAGTKRRLRTTRIRKYTCRGVPQRLARREECSVAEWGFLRFHVFRIRN